MHWQRRFQREHHHLEWSKNSNGLRCYNLRFPRFSSNRFAPSKAPIALTILFPRLGQCDQKASKMIWAQVLAYVTGTVNQELLLRKEYLVAENRILKAQIKGRLLLSEEEKGTLAEIAHRLGRRRWKKWRPQRNRIRFWAGIGSSSQESLMDRVFASKWADQGLLRISSD